MGYYKKQLKLFEQTGLYIWEILCAKEVESCFEIDLTDEQFECIVEFVYNWVMDSEISPNELCHYIINGLKDERFTLEDFTKGNNDKLTDIINNMI